MTILDKLLEKKDVLAYIDFRILSLKNDLNVVMKSTPYKNRELIKERFNGRILELEELKGILSQGIVRLKFKSKGYSRKKVTYLKVGFEKCPEKVSFSEFQLENQK